MQLRRYGDTMKNSYPDSDLLDPNFPDPRRSDAPALIAKYYENKAAEILDEAIAAETRNQTRDALTTQAHQAITNEAHADNWLNRFLKVWGVK